METVCQLVQGWIIPFAENQDLLIISTARTVPRDIASDLMKGHFNGQQCYSRIVNDCCEVKIRTTLTEYQ